MPYSLFVYFLFVFRPSTLWFFTWYVLLYDAIMSAISLPLRVALSYRIVYFIWVGSSTELKWRMPWVLCKCWVSYFALSWFGTRKSIFLWLLSFPEIKIGYPRGLNLLSWSIYIACWEVYCLRAVNVTFSFMILTDTLRDGSSMLLVRRAVSAVAQLTQLIFDTCIEKTIAF